MRRTIVLAAVSILALSAPTAALAQTETRHQINPSRAATQTPPREIRLADAAPAGGVLVLPLASAGDIALRGTGLDAATQASVASALAAARFGYGARQSQSLYGVGGYDHILVIGLPSDARPVDYQTLGRIAGRALASETAPVTIAVSRLDAASAAEIGAGVGIGGYLFDGYHSDRSGAARGPVVLVGAQGDPTAFTRRGQALIDAMALARDLSNEPANVIYPETFVARTRSAFAGVRGVEITVLDEAEMARLGMGSLLSVGQGSPRPSRLMAVRYRGSGAPDQPVVLAGKGITFDSGGVSIKPSAGMGNMKMDMSGAASVVGTTLALARQGAPVHVVAIAALAENMPSGTASRPGDVVRAMNGMTIEINSTDAEGRMVLADAVAWADATLNPAAIVDVATLTGAVRGALGDEYAGLFSRHDALADQLSAASAATGEGLWRLPLHPSYAADLKTPNADLINGGGSGAGAGVGAHFIGAFVKPETPWAHLDIAGVAWSTGPTATGPAGSEGFSVRLLERFVLDYQPVAATPGAGGF